MISDETLMAYADGEVDAATRAQVEAAMQEDPEIGRRVARHQALRDAMRGAGASVLDEPVPERLIAAARGRAPAGTVVDLSRAREAVIRRGPGIARGWQPAAMAASLLVGLALGYLGWHGSAALIKANSSGGLVAGAALAEALSTQLSDERSPARAAAAGMSFRAKSGDYCRTFALTGAAASAGLACHETQGWSIKVLAQSSSAGSATQFRTAGSELSPAIRAAIEASIEGEPLDHAGEVAARQGGWDSRNK
jgi:negative regulator of sigma E activity